MPLFLRKYSTKKPGDFEYARLLTEATCAGAYLVGTIAPVATEVSTTAAAE
jgi:hypothetical protein